MAAEVACTDGRNPLALALALLGARLALALEELALEELAFEEWPFPSPANPVMGPEG
jgi:hypothetical protein